MKRLQMYGKMISGSFLKRKSRIAIALLAIMIGAAVVSGLASVYYDISYKMSKELRAYGANMLLTPGSDAREKVLTEKQLEQALQSFSPDQVVGAAPQLYGIAQVGNQRVVLVGTWFDQVQKVSPYWKLTGPGVKERDSGNSVLIGTTAAEKLEVKAGDSLTLTDEISGRSLEVKVQGIIASGGTEDNQIFLGLKEAQELLGKPGMVNTAYLSIMGKGSELAEQANSINAQFPQIQLKPIKQIASSEGVILDKIKGLVYLVVVIILLSTLLCVAITMMTMVLERRREIGLKKALGAQNLSIALEFLGEGVLLGIMGSFLGSILGYFFAQLIGQSVFASAISFRPMIVPLVVFSSLAVTILASLLPVKTMADVEPAIVLRGE